MIFVLLISQTALADKVPPPRNEQRVVVQDAQTSGGKGRDLALVAMAAIGIGFVIWQSQKEDNRASLFVDRTPSGEPVIGMDVRLLF